MQQGTLLFSFVAGIISFLAPCILPLVPGYLAYLAGVSLKNTEGHRRKIFESSVFFVLGFSLVFAALGVLLNSILGNVASGVQTWLSRIGGALIIFFGLYLTGLVKISFLEREHKLHVTKVFSSSSLTSFVFGAAFAIGWTPCVGAVLGGILALAATQPGSAFWLLLAYAAGLGLPFLLVGFFAVPAHGFITRYARAARHVNTVFGIVLIAVGILIFTENLSLVANFEFLNRWLL